MLRKGLIMGSFILNISIFPSVLCAQNSTLLEIAKEEINIIKAVSLWRETILEAPSPTMVYTEEMIKKFGFKNIRQFLEYLPSIYLIQDVNERVIAWRGMYTTSSNTFLFLEDGQKLDVPSFGNFPLDASYPTKDIKRVEISSGPSSSIYGSNALSGIIQVERASAESSSLSAYYGEYDEKGIDFSLSKKDVYGLMHYQDIPGERNKGVPINPRKDNYALIFKGKVFETPVQLFYFRNQYNTPRSQRGLPLKAEDLEPYGSRERIDYFSTGFKRKIDFNKFTLFLQPSFTYFKADTPQVRTPHHSGNFSALDIELENQRISLLSYAEIPLRGANFLIGLDLAEIYHKRYASKIYNGSELAYTMPKEREFNYALFVQYKRPIGNFILHLGARYDHFELWGERFSPRLALIYAISPSLYLQLNYSEAFNAPPLFYAKANPALGYGSATGLKPEVLKNYSLNLFYQKEPLTFRVTPFVNELKDKIGYNANQRAYVNLPKIKTSGLEFESIYRREHLFAFLNYTYLGVLSGKEAPNVYKNEYIYGIPKTMRKGGVSFKVPWLTGLSISPSFRRYSKSYFSNQKMNAYALWDLNLLYEWKNWQFNLKVENLLDKHYERAGILPPTVWEGRQIKAGFEVKF